MSGNIGISDDEDELDAEEDEREPVDGDPINDDEDEEDGIMAFSSAFLDEKHCTCSPFIHGVEDVMNSMLDAEEDEREPVDYVAVSETKMRKTVLLSSLLPLHSSWLLGFLVAY
ncbi:hypothetical protein C3L33_06489, partial [Rhododendron williamsianum]